MSVIILLSTVSLFLVQLSSVASKYSPDWNSLNTRPIPQWFDDAKFGIMMHWGVYSVQTYANEWLWEYLKNRNDHPEYRQYMKDNFKPKFTYMEFGKDFTCENFNASQWVEIFKASGAKYVIPTSKHHDGYTLWPSSRTFGWNSVDVGPNQDLIKEIADAVRKDKTMIFGLYYSLMEFYNPLFLKDRENKNTSDFVEFKSYPELVELVNIYKPQYIWSDGEWYMDSKYWRSPKFLAWLYNESPVKDSVVVNSRWGKEVKGKHGVNTITDNFNPGTLQKKKFETAMSINAHSWGHRSRSSLIYYRKSVDLINDMAKSVSCGGNFLLNVGPTKDGRIAPIEEERLREVGNWMRVNGQAIYGTKPWKYQKDTVTRDVWFTQKNESVFAIFTRYPDSNSIEFGVLAKFMCNTTQVSMLGDGKALEITKLPKDRVVVKLPPAQISYKINRDGWALEFTKLNFA